jgi:serine/threonine protein kinase
MVWAAKKQLQKGKYTIESVLGRGRFAITYLATDQKGDRIVIKTPDADSLPPDDLERWQQKFVHEAFKLAKCSHPHIVRLLEEPFQEDGLWCIAMEYVDGVDLAHRAKNILPESEALKYIQQIGEALKVVHQNNLVHRDVKPANIMIRNGAAVLIDFGLARGFDSKQLSVSDVEKEAEKGFTPPELYSQTVELGAYTDVYSLAATLYNLLTGQLPTSAKERIENHTPLQPPKELNDSISDKTNRAIIRAMDLSTKTRIQSIDEWLDNIEFNPPNPEPTPPVTSENQREKISFWLTVAGFIVAVIAIFTGIFQSDVREFLLKPFSSPQSTPTASPTKTIN